MGMSEKEPLTAQVLKKVMPAAVNEMADKRIAICNSCDKLNTENRRCLLCGCFMDLKVFLPDVECPLRKW